MYTAHLIMMKYFLLKYFAFVTRFGPSLSFVNNKKRKKKRSPSKILYACIKTGRRKKKNHAWSRFSFVHFSLSLSLFLSRYKITLLANKYISRIPPKLIYSAKRGAWHFLFLFLLSHFLLVQVILSGLRIC
jgi:hypothetical protein